MNTIHWKHDRGTNFDAVCQPGSPTPAAPPDLFAITTNQGGGRLTMACRVHG